MADLVEVAACRQLSSLRDPKQERSRERVAAIISAAISVIAKNGIANARISDIAAQASIMPSSIYDYFSNKEELAYGIAVLRMSELFGVYKSKLTEYQSFVEKLDGIIRTTADYVCRNPDWARVFYLEIWPSVNVQGEARLVVDDYARIFLALLQEGAEAGDWPPQSDVYMTMAIIVGSLNQLIITWLLYRRPHDLRRRAASLSVRLIQLLKSEAEPTPDSRPRAKRNGSDRPGRKG